MILLAELIAVFMVSGAVAQDFDGNDLQFAKQKKPTGCTAGVNWTCQVIGKAERRPTFQCKDPKTGKAQKVQCKEPPDKVTLAELDEACSLRSDNRF